MSNLKTKLKSNLKIIKNFLRMNPHKHWDFIMKISFFSIFILIIFSLFILYQIKNDKGPQYDENENKEPVAVVNELKLKTVNSYFDNKKIKTEEIKNNPFPYEDPSR